MANNKENLKLELNIRPTPNQTLAVFWLAVSTLSFWAYMVFMTLGLQVNFGRVPEDS